MSRKPRLTTVGIRCAHVVTPSIRKSWHYFANKRRSLADQSHGALVLDITRCLLSLPTFAARFLKMETVHSETSITLYNQATCHICSDRGKNPESRNVMLFCMVSP
jgi:hypothetical protein